MHSKCVRDSIASFVFPPSLACPWLSLCACCAVSVDLWYRSQGPLLTDHLYLYCRDTAHNDKEGELGPCGHERRERLKEGET